MYQDYILSCHIKLWGDTNYVSNYQLSHIIFHYCYCNISYYYKRILSKQYIINCTAWDGMVSVLTV